MSEHAREQWKNPVIRERRLGWMQNPVLLALMGEKIAEMWMKPEFRKRHGKAMEKFNDRVRLGRALCEEHGVDPGKDRTELAYIAEHFLEETGVKLYDEL